MLTKLRRRFIYCSSIAFFTVTSLTGTPGKDSLADKEKSPSLSLRASLGIPLYSKIQFEVWGNSMKLNPEFRFFPDIGLQYKTKRNLVFDARFQSFKFSCHSPIFEISNGARVPTYYSYYEIYDYGQFRISFGVGKSFTIKSKHSLSFIAGNGIQVPDQKKLSYKTFNKNGILSDSRIVSNTAYCIFSPYLNLSYSYKLHRKVSFTTEVHYIFIDWQDHGFKKYDFPSSWTKYKTQSLLSASLGLKYYLIH